MPSPTTAAPPARTRRSTAPDAPPSVVLWTTLVLTALVGVLCALAVLSDGGYFPDDYLGIGALAALGVAAGLAAGLLEHRRPSRPALAAVAALLALAAWGGLSSEWSPDPAAAELGLARDVTYAAFLALALLAVTARRRRGLLVTVVAVVLVGACVLALVSRMQPELIETDAELLAYAQGRLSYPVGYWNALGAVAAMAILAAVGIAADRRSHFIVRGLAAAGGTIAGCVLYLTLSRASGIALVIALGVILALSRRRLALATSATLVLAGASLAVLIIRTEPILVDEPGTLAAQQDVGAPILLLVLLVAAGVGAVQAAASRVRVLTRRHRYSARARAPALVKAAPALLVALLLVGVYAGFSDRIEGRAASGTSALGDFLDRQYSEFLEPSGALPAGEERLTTSRSSRSEAYEVAFDAIADDPLRGDGVGGYRVRWIRDRDVAENFRNTHSLPLEILSERGIVGGMLLATLIGVLLVGVARVRHLRRDVSNTVLAGAAGVVCVWLVHAAVDWDWQVAAVTLPALACGAVLAAPGGRREAA